MPELSPEDKIERRRRHAAWLRYCADRQEELAAEMRRNANRIDPDSPTLSEGWAEPLRKAGWNVPRNTLPNG